MRTSGDGTPTSRNYSNRTDATVADVLRAAGDAPVEVIVEVLRTHLKLDRIAVSHALGIDAALYIRAGHRRSPAVLAAADQVWSAVVATPIEVAPGDLGSGWHAAAACRGLDPNLWFCDDRDDPGNDDEIEAVGVCVGCAVIGYCALAALDEQCGLWAGMTDRNRQRLRRYLRVGVVPVDPAAVAPVAVDIAVSSLAGRVASKPAAVTPDGRLFDIPASAEVAAHARSRTRRRSRRQPVEAVPLFA